MTCTVKTIYRGTYGELWNLFNRLERDGNIAVAFGEDDEGHYVRTTTVAVPVTL